MSQHKTDDSENHFEVIDENGDQFFDEDGLERLRDYEALLRDEARIKLKNMGKTAKKKLEQYPIQHQVEYDAVKNKYFIDLTKTKEVFVS